jgi:hypothetical protein
LKGETEETRVKAQRSVRGEVPKENTDREVEGMQEGARYK